MRKDTGRTLNSKPTPSFLGAVATGFHLTAYSLLVELAGLKGRGLWFDDLRMRIRYAAATAEAPDGSEDEVAERWGEAAMTAVDHIFDSVTFKGEAKR